LKRNGETQRPSSLSFGGTEGREDELVRQFIRDKPMSISFGNDNEFEQLKRFSLAIGHFFKEPLLETRGLEDGKRALDMSRIRTSDSFLLSTNSPTHAI